jgi:F-type H+-transporting ATPase subunit b
MELSWSTFFLEIINFLVLVWILKRFLYKPVLEVIARRSAGIEKTRADAAALHADAEDLQKQYESRLADWNRERQQMRETLSHELEAERARQLDALHTELEQEREKARVAESSRQADALRKFEETALFQAARFATHLLEATAGADTEARLVELVINELSQLPDERIAAMRKNYGQTPDAIVIDSAYPLAEDQRERLEQALLALTALKIPLRFEQNSDLLAGVRITIGAWVLGLNLQDELRGMTELALAEQGTG